MTEAFSFTLHKTDAGARLGEIATARGKIATPAFMPVGTAGTVKAVYPDQLKEAGVAMVLANTYHLMLRPGAERIASLGGLHAFMRWDRPILTDSGGFQVMSLAKLRTIKDDGVAFQSHLDGAAHMLTPERAIEIQCLLGADIQMQLDECVALPASEEAIAASVRRSLAWAQRCKRAFASCRERGDAHAGQALFGIVQGGTDADLRARSVEGLLELDFPGYAVGGLAVGESQQAMLKTLECTLPAAAGGPAALSDGGWHPHRSDRGGRTRHRHVRLCHAHAFGPARAGLHLEWQAEPAQCRAQQRSGSARPGQPVSCRA